MRTLRQLREMANSLEPDIRMKEDVGSNYTDNKLPMLDVKLWVEKKEGGGEEIMYNFYEKPMVSKIVLMERSSLPIKSKIQILVQEVVRRKRNTSPNEKKEVVEGILSQFMMKLKMSGYSKQQRWEILKSGTRKYNNLVRQEKEGKRRLNRPSWEGGREGTSIS